MFYNTINLDGNNLKAALTVNRKQEALIEAIFRDNNLKDISPSQIHQRLAEKGYRYPLTSIRRAMTDLACKNILIKNGDDKNVQGIYGKPEHTWKFNNNIPIYLQKELF